ncbi:MAG TPA: hypothetical protein VFA37_01640 [Gaiellaceae bacterium]|nr:hypothetical protein [Gaiellaceae bacterium]
MTLSSRHVRLGAALAAANVVLVAAGWLLLVAPQRHHAQSASQQLQQVQTELAQLGKSGGTQASHPRQPAIRTAGIYRLAQAMPPTADDSDLLLMLGQLGRDSAVHVLGISLQTPTAAVGYVVQPVQLTLSGSYGALTNYLRRLRTLVAMRHGTLVASGRLFSVTTVSLSPSGTGNSESATVGVDAYVYGTVNGVAPLSTAAASTSTTGTSTTSTTTTTTAG